MKKDTKKLEKFWEKEASQYTWSRVWRSVLKGNFSRGTSRWFSGAKLNITINCLDRNLADKADNVALIFEPNEPSGMGIKYSYRELHQLVCKAANVLKDNGVKKGDIVCIYLPMVPMAVVSMLACARIGAIHNVVFAGFSARSLAERINDCGAKVIITSDMGHRGAKELKIKSIVDDAVVNCKKIEAILVVQNSVKKFSPATKFDVSFDEKMKTASSVFNAEIVEANHPLFVLYTSGSTGKPKGIVHSTAGYMVYAGYSFKRVFNYQAGEIYWCTADMGWITGHSYSVYGPFLAGATIVLFEGVPTYPTPSRYWKVVEKHKVCIFYTSPTAIRSLESFGEKYVKDYKLESLRVIGSVGEPLNTEAWHWYNENVGKNRCSIVDTWWQTETGGIMISPQIGGKEKPGSVALPLPTIEPVILNKNGKKLRRKNSLGFLCIQKPWPSLAMTILNDHKRFIKTYFNLFKGYYYSGDVARQDKDGYFYIGGRIDDVINVSGHRIGSAEMEDTINLHKDAVESSVVAFPHLIKGEGIYVFVVLKNGRSDVDIFRKEIIALVEDSIGAFARPERIQIVKDLPKTKSGKIIRRILRKMAAGQTYENEDLTTLVDQNVIKEISKGVIF